VSTIRIEVFDSLILYVSDIRAARSFYGEFLEWSVLFEDEIIVVFGDDSGSLPRTSRCTGARPSCRR
jgi:catechol 2,3-dioxygenase-like lactoylglutathione lyase family enzyme